MDNHIITFNRNFAHDVQFKLIVKILKKMIQKKTNHDYSVMYSEKKLLALIQICQIKHLRQKKLNRKFLKRQFC